MHNTSKDIWDSMKIKYQGSTKVKHAQLQAIRSKFEALAMKEGESINNYFRRTLKIENKMFAHGDRKEEIVIFEKIFRSMTSRFNYVVCTIEESNDVTTLSIDELQCRLLVQEARMNSHKENDDE